MLPRYEVKPPPPAIRLRDVARLLTLGIMIVFLFYAVHKAGDRRTWQWVRAFGESEEASEKTPERPEQPPPAPPPGFTEMLRQQHYAGQAVGFLSAFTNPTLTPAAVDGALAVPLHLDCVPLPAYQADQAPVTIRRAPVPNPQVLGGAMDRQRFLLDNPVVSDELPEHFTNEQKRLDADARYHLLFLAHSTTAEALSADARRDVRYTALREKPADYRGEVIHVEGDLIWVQHFELKRQVPGLEHAYSGGLIAGGSGQRYFLLFTELPPNFPPEKEWSKLYRRGVKFDGYFLKVLLDDDPKEKGKYVLHPVLVGKTIHLPAVEDGGWDFPIVPILAGLLFIAVVVLVVGYYYRRGEEAHAQRLLAVRQRARAADDEAQGGSDSLNPLADSGALEPPRWNATHTHGPRHPERPPKDGDETRFGPGSDTR